MAQNYYENMCKKCWHSWKTEGNKKPEKCPKCESENIDCERNIRLSE